MRNKWVIVYVLIIASLVTWQISCAASAHTKPEKDSKELKIQDMLVLFLLPYMKDKLSEVYSTDLKGAPDLYPYFIDVKQVDRLNGFRGFEFQITLEATPTVGPHIAVGDDLFTFEVKSGVDVKLVKFEHLKGPNKKDFPPNYQDLLTIQ
ncbi:hypothetical protein QFZ77_004856 [Paenibacillus sp. V4I3]|uniref:DUF3888 domain-containing protein n=1 Tax=unclassified Paenibacillus TaxID=185978 RepID=UPI0027897C31|nr:MULTISPECIES: DUF3888 domain-containing protein [unclassified Paenibacillus]MDQ0876197.1 hypothetical protein [Paenibacillus sp. V4I3]MDQ0887767.1 hypothetical protein [Paenibacillus sp. V4I9]